MKIYDRECRADEGKMFVLTEKGKEWASYKNHEVGKPISEDKTWASLGMIEDGALIEVDNPDWIECKGYVVGYYHKGFFLSCGNYQVLPSLEIAEYYKKHCENEPYLYNDAEIVIKEAIYKGEKPKEMEQYQGRNIIDRSNYYGLDYHKIGDLFNEEMYWHFMDCVPPKCMKASCSQVGEPHSHKVDEEGNVKPTYATFVKLAEGVWEYKGHCFYGETEEKGIETTCFW